MVLICLELRLRNFLDEYVFYDGILWMFPNSVNGNTLFGENVVAPRDCLFQRRILRTMCKKHFSSPCKTVVSELKHIDHNIIINILEVKRC